LVGGTAIAQSADQVDVQGKRVLNTNIVGRSSSGVPVVDVSLGYDVSLADLDLASNAENAELARRLNVAAEAACRQISRQYPDATPSDAECASEAASKAMVRARQLVAATPGK
jgi:UrcA family protein